MKKKLMGFIILLIAVIGISMNVYADESVYYTNPNGVELTQEEYEFLQSFYWDGYPEIMTEAQYNRFISLDMMHREISKKTYTDIPDSIQSTSHSTSAKTLTISAACSTSNCILSLVNSWTVSPATRSYDVIGMYFNGVSLLSNDLAFVSSTAGTTYYNNTKSAVNGFGNSVKLPSSGSGIVIVQEVTTSRGGTVYGSYQHAVDDITLAVSKLYNFSIGGYGRVFAFYGNAVGKFDGMNGVDISI